MKTTLMLAVNLVLAAGVWAQAIEGAGYTLPLGDSWVLMTDEDLAAIHANVEAIGPQVQVRYDTGAIETSTAGSVYLLVQHFNIPIQGASYDDIEQAFGAVSADDIAIDGLDLEMGVPVLDRERNRIVSLLSMNSEFESVSALSVGFLGKGKLVQVHFYAPTDAFET